MIPGPGSPDPIPQIPSGDLEQRLRAWIAEDPAADQADAGPARAASRDDRPRGRRRHLADRFARKLEFGTAGLRGAIAAGPNRMNRAVVRAATAALAWLPDAAAGPGPGGRGHRLRRPPSLGEFAAEAARVLTGAGIRVHLLPGRSPTPLLAFGVRHLSAAAGMMITASHNPPADNGYKLYLGDGADRAARRCRDRVGDRQRRPLAGIPLGPRDPLITRHGDEIARAYLNVICSLSPPRRAPAGAAGLRFVYTPLHGVAGSPCSGRSSGRLPAPDVVAAQAEPDPDFPTVSFPNPEEPGALDLALAPARVRGPTWCWPTTRTGTGSPWRSPILRRRGWRVLTGDQVGALLGAFLLGQSRPGPGSRTPPGQHRGSRQPAGPGCGRILAAGGRHDRRVVDAAVQDRRGGRRAVRADADRVQVDRPGGG